MAAEAAQNKAEEKRQITDALEAERQDKLTHDVVYAKPTRSVVHNEVAGDDGEVVIEEIVVESPTRRIRVNFPIQEMTFGREVHSPGEYDETTGLMTRSPVLGGLRSYSFEEGRYYVVDADVADHLASLGYIYE
jgi:hypothetical protein